MRSKVMTYWWEEYQMAVPGSVEKQAYSGKCLTASLELEQLQPGRKFDLVPWYLQDGIYPPRFLQHKQVKGKKQDASTCPRNDQVTCSTSWTCVVDSFQVQVAKDLDFTLILLSRGGNQATETLSKVDCKYPV